MFICTKRSAARKVSRKIAALAIFLKDCPNAWPGLALAVQRDAAVGIHGLGGCGWRGGTHHDQTHLHASQMRRGAIRPMHTPIDSGLVVINQWFAGSFQHWPIRE